MLENLLTKNIFNVPIDILFGLILLGLLALFWKIVKDVLPILHCFPDFYDREYVNNLFDIKAYPSGRVLAYSLPFLIDILLSSLCLLYFDRFVKGVLFPDLIIIFIAPAMLRLFVSLIVFWKNKVCVDDIGLLKATNKIIFKESVFSLLLQTFILSLGGVVAFRICCS